MDRMPKMVSGKFSTTHGIRCWPKLLFLLPDHFLYTARLCVYINKSECLIRFYMYYCCYRNNNASETFLNKSGKVRRVDWIFIIMVSGGRRLGEYAELDKTFTVFFSNNKSYQPQLLRHFISYHIPRRGPLLEI
jgi:hypothetical protein